MLHHLCRSTLFFTLPILGIAGTGYAQENVPVNIPDANLRAVIKRALDKPAGATITNTEIATLTDLGGSRANIRDLTGPEFATNLISLHLRANQLSDLSPLLELTNLKDLNIQSNPLSSKTITDDLPVFKTKGVYVMH